MVEKIGHIKNPLTVIAIFAGIAEISGTAILPLIEPEIQIIYVWFLMAFPFFLVGVFFYTLHKKPTALYSPSDYQDEGNFVTVVRNATPAELSFKLRQEVKEVESDIQQQEPERNKLDAAINTAAVQPLATDHLTLGQPTVEIASPTVPTENASIIDSGIRPNEQVSDILFSGNSNKSLHYRALGDLMLAEKLAVSRLAKILNIGFQHHVQISIPGERGITFDAFAFGKDIAHAVEVKLFATPAVDMSRLREAVDDAEKAGKVLSASGIKTFLLHLYIVSELGDLRLSSIKNQIVTYASEKGVFIKVHTTKMTDLANDYQLGQVN